MQVDTIRDLVTRSAARHPELRCKLEHAAFISLFRQVTPELDGTWRVGSEREPDRIYRVRLEAEPGTPFCTCQDSQRHIGSECKHSLAVLMVFRALADQLGIGRHAVFDEASAPTPIGTARVAPIQYDRAGAAEYDRVFARFEGA